MNDNKQLCNYKNCKIKSKYFLNDKILCGTHFKLLYNNLYNIENSTLFLKDIKNLKFFSIKFKQTKKYDQIQYINDIIKKNINTKYNVINKLGEGEFGTVYLISDNISNGNEYALKIVIFNKEKIKSSNKAMNILYHERSIYNHLWVYNTQSISSIITNNDINQNNMFKYKKDEFTYLLLEYFPKILTKKIEKKLNIEDIKHIIKQLLISIKELHKCNYIHNDLKPDNIMFNNNNELKLIDFGLCSRFLTPLKEHIIQKSMGMTGNERFASIDALKKLSTSRRSDIESIGYIMIYLLNPKHKIFKFKNIEENIENKNLLINNNFIIDDEISNINNLYFKELKKYEFHTRPNYEYLISLFE